MLTDIQTMKYFFMIYMTTVSVKQVSSSSWFALPILLMLFVCFFLFIDSFCFACYWQASGIELNNLFSGW